jgi:hypothetical protein
VLEHDRLVAAPVVAVAHDRPDVAGVAFACDGNNLKTKEEAPLSE